MNPQLDIIIVIPAMDEEATIGKVIDGITTTLSPHKCEVIVVDGGSSDKTAEIAEQKGARILHQEGSGYGDALQTGFDYAMLSHQQTSLIGMLDADGTYDPGDLPALLEPIVQDRADLVLGNRMVRMEHGAMSLTNRIGNRILSMTIRRLLHIQVHDTQSGFRLFRSDLTRCIDLRTTGMPFATEMLIEAKEANARIREVPISYRQRSGNTKLNPLVDGFRILGTIIRLTRDYNPIVFFGGLGVVLLVAGCVTGFQVVAEWIMRGTITRLASVVLSSLLVMSAIQLFSLGLLADMTRDVKNRVIKKIR